MTREEREKAIDLLDNLIGMVEDNQDNDYDKALKMGIESLRKEPCADAVSRKAIVEMLNARVQGSVMTFDHFIELLYKLPSVTPTQRWIPVSEKLPKIHNRCEKYLVTLEHGGTYVALFTECDEKHWWAYDDVVAWMPLPKPYQEKEKDENRSN